MEPSADLQTQEAVADVLERLGEIPANRIRLLSAPGTAREEDVVCIHDHENRLFELVEGGLVEKAKGLSGSQLAVVLIHILERFLDTHALGIVMGADGMMRTARDLVRIPDVSFVSWDRLPGRRVPREPISALVPDLAVEVLSEGNTQRERKRKVAESFAAGVCLVWLVSPDSRDVEVHTAPDRVVRLGLSDALDGGEVLPGFSLPVREWFARADREAPKA